RLQHPHSGRTARVAGPRSDEPTGPVVEERDRRRLGGVGVEAQLLARPSDPSLLAEPPAHLAANHRREQRALLGTDPPRRLARAGPAIAGDEDALLALCRLGVGAPLVGVQRPLALALHLARPIEEEPRTRVERQPREPAPDHRDPLARRRAPGPRDALIYER